MVNRIIMFAMLIACSVATASGQEIPRAYVGARIIPIVGPELPRGTLVVHEGRIIAVGELGATAAPEGTERIDVTGKVIMPGLICTHSHVGQPSGGDSSGAVHPEARVLDSINCRDAGFQKAQAGGLTTMNIMPGSGHLLSGQTVYVKNRDANTIEEMVIRNADGSIAGGMKMANGTNSQREPPFPGTRAKSAAMIRQEYVHAQDYRDRIRRAAGDPEKMPDRDLRMEGLVEVLDGKRVVHHHTHRHDDVMTVIRLSREFGFRVVLHHVSEGWKIAEEIAEAGVPCSIILVDSPGGKLEARDLLFHTGGVLEKAGVLTAFHTDDGITDSRLFFRMAALGVRAGMSRQKALEALTIAGAKMLELDDRIGSLEAGKDADFIILSGDPLSVYTKVLETYVDGVRVFDRSDPKDLLYATGGYGASHDQHIHMCCYEDEGGAR